MSLLAPRADGGHRNILDLLGTIGVFIRSAFGPIHSPLSTPKNSSSEEGGEIALLLSFLPLVRVELPVIAFVPAMCHIKLWDFMGADQP